MLGSFRSCLRLVCVNRNTKVYQIIHAADIYTWDTSNLSTDLIRGLWTLCLVNISFFRMPRELTALADDGMPRQQGPIS